MMLLFYFCLLFIQPTADQYLISQMCAPVEGCVDYNLSKGNHKYISYNVITKQLYIKLDSDSGMLLFEVEKIIKIDGRKVYYFCNNEGLLSIGPFGSPSGTYDRTSSANAVLEVHVGRTVMVFNLTVVKLIR